MERLQRPIFFFFSRNWDESQSSNKFLVHFTLSQWKPMPQTHVHVLAPTPTSLISNVIIVYLCATYEVTEFPAGRPLLASSVVYFSCLFPSALPHSSTCYHHQSVEWPENGTTNVYHCHLHAFKPFVQVYGIPIKQKRPSLKYIVP